LPDEVSSFHAGAVFYVNSNTAIFNRHPGEASKQQPAWIDRIAAARTYGNFLHFHSRLPMPLNFFQKTSIPGTRRTFKNRCFSPVHSRASTFLFF
jgi:hypothetical protein